MLFRLITTGALILGSATYSLAADPLIPPAPTRDSSAGQSVGDPLPLPQVPSSESIPHTPAPPAPGLTTPRPISPTPIPETPPAPAASARPAPAAVPVAPPAAVQQPNSYVLPYGYGMNGSVSEPGVYPGPYPYGVPPYNSFSTNPGNEQRYVSGPPGGEHARYPYYSYRRPWYSPGPVSRNVNIVW